MASPPAGGLVGALLSDPKVREFTSDTLSSVIEHPAIKGWFQSIVESVVPGGWAMWSETQVQSRAAQLKRLAAIRAQVENTAGNDIAEFVAWGLKDYFGVVVDPRAFSGAVGGASGGAQAASLGDALLRGMFGEFLGTAAPTPESGTANVHRLLGWGASNAVEGWLIKTLGLGYIAKDLPDVGDLGDLVANAVGVQRIVRRALAPLLNALVVTPARQDFARRYRNELPNVAQATRLHAQGRMDWASYSDVMGRLGYSDALALDLFKLSLPILSRSDLRQMLERETITPAAAKAELQRQGFTEEVAGAQLDLLQNDKLPSINQAMVQVARDMYRSREIDEGVFLGIVSSAGYTAAEGDAVLALAQLERSRPKPMDRSTMERAYREGFIELADLSAYYVGEGYESEDVAILEQLAVKARLDEEEKDQAAALRKLRNDPATVAASVAEQAYIRGIIDQGRLTEALRAKGYGPDEITLRVATATKKRQAYADAVAKRQAAKAGISASAGPIEEAYVRGLVTEGQLTTFYLSRGFSPADVGLLVLLRHAEKADWDAARAKKAAAGGAGPPRPPT